MSQMVVRYSVAALMTAIVVAAPAAAVETRTLRVEAGKLDRIESPVRAIVQLPAELADAAAVCIAADGARRPAQLTSPSLLANAPTAGKGMVVREVNFIVPKLPAGETAEFKLQVGAIGAADQESYAWGEADGKSVALVYDGAPVIRYMYEAIDTSSPERREQTFKPFHHVLAPGSDERLLTKGPGGRYTHHRGLFFGFNKCSYGEGRKADVWHCNGDAFQSHEEFLSQQSGPVLGRQRVAIDWHGQAGEVFAQEQRELTVYAVPGGRLIEFASLVRPVGGPVRLDGDPQHAGFHFRAANEVADSTAAETYYLRPDGQGEQGATRNWPDQRGHVNLAWNAMSFVLGGDRYTAVYLDRPENPKEARFSERDYGRFGSYFEYDLTEEAPLAVNYRVWIQDGEITADQAAALDADFVAPARATVVPSP